MATDTTIPDFRMCCLEPSFPLSRTRFITAERVNDGLRPHCDLTSRVISSHEPKVDFSIRL
jgi:hypothetical protein